MEDFILKRFSPSHLSFDANSDSSIRFDSINKFESQIYAQEQN